MKGKTKRRGGSPASGVKRVCLAAFVGPFRPRNGETKAKNTNRRIENEFQLKTVNSLLNL